MSDLMRLFRDHAQSRDGIKELTVEKGKLYYVFGQVAYPASTLTALKTWDKKSYYTLESIANFWKHRGIIANYGEYVREVSKHSIPAVNITQRNNVMAYLEGKTEELQDHDQAVQIATPITLVELMEQQEIERGGPRAKRARLDENDSSIHEYKDDMEVDGQSTSDETQGLASKFSAEKIAQMRSKVQQNIKAHPRQLIFSQPDITDPLANLPFAEAGDSCTKAIQECELPSSSRTQLYSCGNSFDHINGYFTKSKQTAPQTNGRQAITQPQARVNRQAPTGYSRYDQEVFHSEPDADFQIETNLSFHGTAFNAIRSNNLNPSINSNAQFSQNDSSEDLHRRGINNNNTAPPFSRDHKPGFGPPTAVHPNGRPPKRESRTPIIIIPASGTALITMYNAVDILQNLRYVPTDQRKKEGRRESDLIIHRKKADGKTVPYRVIDDPRKLRDEEWDRIVAVFVQGPAWQFKGWKYHQQPTEIFSKICAFHLKFDEQPLDKNVANWSVRVLSFSQQKRHLDRAVMHDFWNTLDNFIVRVGLSSRVNY